MDQTKAVPRIYIISGGVGASGEQLVNTVLAQFPEGAVEVVTVGNVREPEQVRAALREARAGDGLVVYTLVDPRLQEVMRAEENRLGVQALDLMSPLLDWVTQKTGEAPRGEPGYYRQLRREYFERIAAIDFSLAHDDGKNPAGWVEADAVLVGVSRVGKTPLSLYLAVLGWRVANYPLVPSIAVPVELDALDPQRVFGLTIEPGQLLQYRIQRQKRLGAPGSSAYVDPQAVYAELEAARTIFRRGRFVVIDMTDKTIEHGADEILRHLNQVTAPVGKRAGPGRQSFSPPGEC